MKKLLRKGHSGVISKLHSIQAVQTPSVHIDLQYFLSQHHVVFQTPRDFPLLEVSMIIPFLSFQVVFLQIFSLVIIHSPTRMKLRTFFNNL
jgi:hypothetical protein